MKETVTDGFDAGKIFERALVIYGELCDVVNERSGTEVMATYFAVLLLLSEIVAQCTEQNKKMADNHVLEIRLFTFLLSMKVGNFAKYIKSYEVYKQIELWKSKLE